MLLFETIWAELTDATAAADASSLGVRVAVVVYSHRRGYDGTLGKTAALR